MNELLGSCTIVQKQLKDGRWVLVYTSDSDIVSVPVSYVGDSLEVVWKSLYEFLNSGVVVDNRSLYKAEEDYLSSIEDKKKALEHKKAIGDGIRKLKAKISSYPVDGDKSGLIKLYDEILLLDKNNKYAIDGKTSVLAEMSQGKLF